MLYKFALDRKIFTKGTVIHHSKHVFGTGTNRLVTTSILQMAPSGKSR
jgi:hypothetical protein